MELLPIQFIKGANGSRIYLKSTIIPPTISMPAQVLNPATWVLSSFSSLTQQFIFDGVQLVCDPGTTVMAGSLAWQFINGATYTLNPIT